MVRAQVLRQERPMDRGCWITSHLHGQQGGTNSAGTVTHTKRFRQRNGSNTLIMTKNIMVARNEDFQRHG